MSLYAASVPVFTHILNNLSAILKKGEEFADERKIDETVMTSLRLAPDMFALARQVQIACDIAKGAGGRLAGVELPKYEDDETTFAQLQERIQKTISFLESLPAAGFEGAENKTIELKVGPYEMSFKGDVFLYKWSYPNLYFHVTSTYNILRHNGVQIGKKDFLGEV